MTRKRDGPQPQQTAKGPEQKGDERPRLLPRAQTPRKTTQGHTLPSSHRRKQRRQPSGWREFRVRLVTKPGTEGAAALYAYLRAAAKRFGIAVGSIDEIHENDHEDH